MKIQNQVSVDWRLPLSAGKHFVECDRVPLDRHRGLEGLSVLWPIGQGLAAHDGVRNLARYSISLHRCAVIGVISLNLFRARSQRPPRECWERFGLRTD